MQQNSKRQFSKNLKTLTNFLKPKLQEAIQKAKDNLDDDGIKYLTSEEKDQLLLLRQGHAFHATHLTGGQKERVTPFLACGDKSYVLDNYDKPKKTDAIQQLDQDIVNFITQYNKSAKMPKIVIGAIIIGIAIGGFAGMAAFAELGLASTIIFAAAVGLVTALSVGMAAYAFLIEGTASNIHIASQTDSIETNFADILNLGNGLNPKDSHSLRLSQKTNNGNNDAITRRNKGNVKAISSQPSTKSPADYETNPQDFSSPFVR